MTTTHIPCFDRSTCESFKTGISHSLRGKVIQCAMNGSIGVANVTVAVGKWTCPSSLKLDPFLWFLSEFLHNKCLATLNSNRQSHLLSIWFSPFIQLGFYVSVLDSQGIQLFFGGSFGILKKNPSCWRSNIDFLMANLQNGPATVQVAVKHVKQAARQGKSMLRVAIGAIGAIDFPWRFGGFFGMMGF